MRNLKDSGVEWLGDIPESWEIVQLGSLFAEHKQKNSGMQSSNLLSLSYGNIIRKDINTSDGLLPESFEGYNVIKNGDIVLRLTDLQNDHRSLRVGLCYETGIVTSAYVTLRSRSEFLNSQYFYYLMHSFDIKKGFYGMGAGVRQGLNYAGVSKILLAVPSEKEQIKIANFLSAKLESTDSLIKNVNSQISRLKAYKKSIIFEAITQGLDKNSAMKDSGYAWIGNVAECFQVMRLKDVAFILDQFRKPITADQRNQDAEVLYDYYGASGAIDKIDGYTIDDHVMLIGEDGANLRMRNLPLMYEVNGKAWINNHAHILKPKNNMLFYYLFYALEGLDINPYITGSAQPKLNQENLKIIPIPVPSLETQEKIVEHISYKLKKIDELIALKQAKIDKLQLYRNSLIYEYVTGKKEVS